MKIQVCLLHQKNRIGNILKGIVEADDFPSSGAGAVGTHSIRKLPATYARNNGCDRDDVDARGHWKSARRIVDTYIGTVLLYPDDKVASVLCVGGAVKYEVKEDSGVTDEFILNTVVPYTKQLLGQSVALVLGKALLWGMCDSEFLSVVTSQHRTNVMASINALTSLLAEGVNAVEKVVLIISGHGGNLFITEVVSSGSDGNNNAPPPNNLAKHGNRQGGEVMALFSEL